MRVTLDLVTILIGDAMTMGIGATAWRRNRTSGAARSFFIATLAFDVWLTTNYFSIQPYDLHLVTFITRLTYVGGLWLMLAAWYFCYRFPTERSHTVVTRVISILLLTIGSAFSYSDLVLQSISYQQGKIQLHTSVGYPLYGVLIGGLAVACVVSLRRNYQDSDLVQRNQIRYVAFGIITSATFSIIFNVVLVPMLGPQWGSPLINFLVTSPIVIFLGYGLIRNRYTDVHRILSVVTTYLTCLALLGAWLLLTKNVLMNAYPDSLLSKEIGFLLSASVAIFVFQPIKRIIKSHTDRWFSVGWYDPQVLLNTMGSMLAGELHVAPLLKNSLQYLCTQLQVPSGEIVVLGNGKAARTETFGIKQGQDVVDVSVLPKSNKLIIVDDLAVEHPAAKELRKHGIRIGIPLVTRGRRIGYLFLGIKAHGDIFSPQDVTVLEILSSQLAVAIVSAQAYEQISQFNSTLQEEIAEATVDLRKTHAKLQVDDRMKTEFIILTSHHLRTPLSIVKGYISLLEDTKLDEAQKNLVESMKTGTERLSQFTEDLLAIDSIVAGNQLVLQPMAAADILLPLVSEARETAKTSGVEFIADLDVHDATVDANQLRLSGAIRNLLDNAFKFTKEGSITLAASLQGKNLQISITDTGIGIPAEELPNIFERFHRATSVLNYDYDGEGIGLYLASLVVKEHNGQIVAKSVLGKGSEFIVTIPLAFPAQS